MRVISIGEVLWDVIGDREFLGGAPLNFSICAQRLGNEAALVSAVGADARGARALKSIRAHGIRTEFIHTLSDHPTGTAVATMDASGSAAFQIIRPAAYDFPGLDDSALRKIADARPDWIYFGTLAQTAPDNKALLHRLIDAVPAARRFYDMNLRDGQWSLELVRRLSELATVVKLNESEAETLFRMTHVAEKFSMDEFCRYWSQAHDNELICVTLGERGCAVWTGGALRMFPGVAVNVVDTVGAGDAFSAAFLHGFHLGWPMERVAAFANELGALVAARAGATPEWRLEELPWY
ncbi:MAG TPA: carbohydrate kinase [Acidobacteriaceae bacterium]|nr:carbohydrate kinase [Acidobacteriaceae bacterium]